MILATLHPATHAAAIVALPVGLDAQGLRLAMPREHWPDLAVGCAVSVILDLEIAAFRGNAVVHAAEIADREVELHITWVDPERTYVRMPGAIHEALLHSQARFGHPIRAQLGRPAGWRGRLLDLTSTEITIGVEPSDAPEPASQVQIRLDLGDGGEPAVLRARCRSQIPFEDEVAITAIFAGTPSALRRLDDRIHGALSDRQVRGGSMP